MGAFTQVEVMVAIRPCTNSEQCLFFEVKSEGRLIRVSEEASTDRKCAFQRIRVVAAAGRKWMIDPDPEQLSSA